MYFDGRPLRITEFCGFRVESIIDVAEKTPCQDVLFGDTERLAGVDLSKLRAHVNVEDMKHSFVMDPDNCLLEGREMMMEGLKKSRVWDKMMKMEAGGLRFKAKGVNDYESSVQTFLEYMLILIHVTGGQPGRGERRSRR
jgi:hypothetical protein